MDLNKVQIIGRLTRDPEARTLPSGGNVATFSVATSFVWTNKEGQKQEKTEFHNIVAWRKLADICAQYLRKGKRVYIEGRLTTRSWDDQSGTKKYRTEIVAENMIMLDGRGMVAEVNKPEIKDEENLSSEKDSAKPKTEGEEEVNIEDIPF